jgi:hypothetical protein
MASFPNSKIHKPSRKKLGKGQVPPTAPATVTPSVATTTVTLTASVPGIFANPTTFVATGGTIVSQGQLTPTTYQIVYTATQAAAVWTLPAHAFTTNSGGTSIASSGTF